MLDKLERQVEELKKLRNSKASASQSMFEGEASIPLQPSNRVSKLNEKPRP